MSLPLSILQHELGLTAKTLVDWNNFMREICSNYVQDHLAPIGGRGKIVEIDESLFFKTKYNRGRRREKNWVFGGCERGNSKNCFFVCVENRNRHTLIPLIKKHILPGSVIVSDEWAAYNGISSVAGFDYVHWKVNHSLNFVNPSNQDAHTQTIESCWGRLKKVYRIRNGTSNQLFSSYMNQFIFQSRFPYPTTFGHILFYIHQDYPV